jgi:glycosyltransferase involved in cell wall biosynthesis
MNISVIVRTFNSDNYIKRCLNSIFKQVSNNFEVIIVDSCSIDNTIQIARQEGCEIITYPINDIPFNYSKALNLGIRQAKGDYLLIISSHVWLPNKNSVKWMLDKLNEDDSIKAVSLSRSQEEDKLNADIQIPFGKTINIQNFKGEGMYNYCSLIRKSDWEKYNFREDIPTCEDQDWIWHWMKTTNATSFIFRFPLAGYDNPNYNLAKDIQEYHTMGKYIYPYYSSWFFIFSLYRKSLLFTYQKRLGKAKHFFKLASALAKFKFMPGKLFASDDYLKNKS